MRYVLTQDKDWFAVIQDGWKAHGVGATLVTTLPETGRAPADARSILIDQSFWEEERAGLTQLVESAKGGEIPVFFLVSETTPGLRERAFRQGADEVLIRSDVIAATAEGEALCRRFEIQFWGARGTLPVSGLQTLKYGGSTSSLGLRFGLDRQFVFDAGTGLRNFSNHLGRHAGGEFKGRILITHPHWDHLNCLPFFMPFYNPESQIHLMGPPQGDLSFKAILDGQMNGVYFPIGTDCFRADVTYEDLMPGRYLLDGIAVSALQLDHPGTCLGYRVDFKGRSVAYITDNELGARDATDPYMEVLTAFLHEVDVLIHDCSYFDDEYPRRESWGHSSIGQVVQLAELSKVKQLFLFHHDPEHEDRDIDRKQVEAEAVMARLGSQFTCFTAKEGDRFDLQSLLLLDPVV